MGTLENAVVTVGTTATVILTADSDGTNFSVKNKTGEVLYLGKSDVTADTTAATGGYQVANDGEFSGRLDPSDTLYGRCATTGGAVCVLSN